MMEVEDNKNDFEEMSNFSIDTQALEDIVLEIREKEIAQLQELRKKVCYLHTNLLYYRKENTKIGTACYEAWKVLIKKVGGTPNGWRDLGYALGVSQDALDYIMASVKCDPADTLIMTYQQYETATMDKIVDAFIKLKRYDILKAIEEPLCKLAQCFNVDDSGYHSNEKNTGHREVVSLKNQVVDLPPALNIKMVIKKKGVDKSKPPSNLKDNTNDSTRDEHPILFLTFAQDGLPTAINIHDYVNSWSDIQDVKVVTLSGLRDEIYQNPEKFIREYFKKADLIIPIITPQYLEEITSYNITAQNTTENLDHKYVNFIYSLIINNYIHASGCLNKKVRSVVPQNADPELYQKISMYPDLMPWTYETDFDVQFQAFLKPK